MSQHNNIYNILDKLHKLDPTVKTPVETNTKPIYESVEANGSIFSGIKKVEQKLSEDFNSFKEQDMTEGDVMRHTGDKTVKVLKKAGKPIGEIGIDGDASPGGGQYYVKLYDGSLDESGFDTAKEAWEELTYAVKQGVAEGSEGDIAEVNDEWFKQGAFKTFKKAAPVKYQLAQQPGTVNTLEGPVRYEAGHYIMTGPKGERYPISPDKFNTLYDDNGDGTATPKKISKLAKLADHDGVLHTSWGDLQYTKGNDYIVRHGTGDYGAVKKDIFAQTYDNPEQGVAEEVDQMDEAGIAIFTKKYKLQRDERKEKEKDKKELTRKIANGTAHIQQKYKEKKQGVAEDTNPRKAGYGTYGTEYQGDNDDEEENQRQADAGKRGRGRPRTRPIKVSKGTGKRGRPVGTGKNQQTTGKKYEPAALHTALGGGTAPKKHANSRTVKPLGKNEGFERLFQKKLNESCLMDDSGNTFNHILNTYKRDVSDFKKTCNVQDLSDHLYNALYDYYEDDMPYAVKSASSRRDAPDPYEWITERFCQDLGLDKTATTEEGIAVAGPMPLADADNELNELAKLAGLKVADEGNAFTGKLAKTRNGDMFDLDGIKYTDTSTLDEGHCDSCNCNPCECSNDMYPTLEAKGDYGDTTINEVPDYINAPDEEVMSTDAIVHQGNDLNREKKQFASKPKLGDNPMAETTEIDPIATLGRALMQEYETLKLSK